MGRAAHRHPGSELSRTSLRKKPRQSADRARAPSARSSANDAGYPVKDQLCGLGHDIMAPLIGDNDATRLLKWAPPSGCVSFAPSELRERQLLASTSITEEALRVSRVEIERAFRAMMTRAVGYLVWSNRTRVTASVAHEVLRNYRGLTRYTAIIPPEGMLEQALPPPPPPPPPPPRRKKSPVAVKRLARPPVSEDDDDANSELCGGDAMEPGLAESASDEDVSNMVEEDE